MRGVEVDGQVFALNDADPVPDGASIVGYEDEQGQMSMPVDPAVPIPGQQPPEPEMRPEDLGMDQLAQLGLVRTPGQAARSRGWKDRARVGRVDERAGAPEMRDDMRGRAEEIARAEGEIELDDNARMRQFVDQELAERQAGIDEKEREVAQVERRYAGEREQLDARMQEQRDLVKKGFGMDRLLGSPAGVFGSLLASSGMAVAAAGGSRAGRNAMDLHDRNMKNMLRSQEMEFNASQGQVDNAFAKLQHTYGDRDQARAALELMMNDALKFELQKLQLQNADPRVKAAVEARVLEIDQKAEALEEAFHERSTGKVTEAFDEGQSYVAPGVRQATMKERANMLKAQASFMKAQADLRGAQGLTDEGLAPDGLKGRQKQINDYATANQTLDFLNKMSRMRGEEGLNFGSGEYVGQSDALMEDRVPGRGLMGSMTKKLPGVNQKGTEYDRMVDQAINAYRQAITGQAAAEQELNRIVSQIDSTFEAHHLAGIQALTERVLSMQKGIEGTVDRKSAAWLRSRRDETLGSSISPGSFGDTRRGGGG